MAGPILNHGGNPDPTNVSIGIDSTDLKIVSPAGADTWVIPASDTFTLAMVFTLSGSFASFIANLGVSYTVTYTFSGLGNPDGTPLSVTKTTSPGQLTYQDPDTTVSVTAGSLPAGKYNVVAAVTFGGAPPMSAYIELPVLDIY